ncbi:TPA: hypothetical protein ACIAIE_005579 [Serratia fonticola]
MAEKWEAFEIQFLTEAAGQMSGLLISEKLERTPRAIQKMARKIGVSLRMKPEEKEQS